jgi:alkylhydroperoxidase family enzyme
MAFIRDVPEIDVPPPVRVPDPDHIIQIHRIHPEVMRQHFDLYRELMHRPGPLSRFQRELLAVRISAINQCHY